MKYKKIYAILLFILGFTSVSCKTAQKEPVDYVNPLIETTKSRYFYFSSACRPFGMVNLSPDMVLSGAWNSGYRYQEPYVRGLTHVHAWGLGGLLVMPVSGDVDVTQGPEAWKSKFSHEKETAKAGYHQLYLDKYGINVELTSTTRVGMHRYTFEKNNEADILVYLGGWLGAGVMMDSHITKTTENEIQGWVQQHHFGWTDFKSKLFFVIQTDRPFESAQIWQDQKPLQALKDSSLADNQGVKLHFTGVKGETIQLKAAISWCSEDQARLNLNTELAHWDFNQVKQESRDEWNQWLSRIEIKGGTEAQRTKFYTDLWHSLLGRRQIQDVNGKYPNYMSGNLQIGQIPLDENGKPKFRHLNSDAWWLTMWNLNTLWGMAYPEILNDVVNSSMTYYKDGGHLPRGPLMGRYSWIMTGSAITELIVGTYNKGIRNYDINEVFAACKKAHMPGSTMDMINGKLTDYIERGYIPEDEVPHVWGGAGRVMENVAQDWALAQLAHQLGKDEDYNYFMKRSENWTNHFDPTCGFIRARNEDGSWFAPFDPMRSANYAGFVEANSWQATWIAVHDVQGLANLLGGRQAYCDKLNYAFEHSSHYNFVGGHGNTIVNYANQPGCAMAHLFNYAGAPWLSQYWVRQVQSKAYSGVTPYDGYGGYDEDQGQMGSLSALMSLGIFQVRGGCDENATYEITSPIFDEVIIHLDNNYYPGKTFTIKANNNSDKNCYIQSATLNGKPLNNCWFTHNDFKQGGQLTLNLGDKPNKQWGIETLPESVTKGSPEYKITEVRYPARIRSGAPCKIEYTVENTGSMGTFFGKIRLADKEVAQSPTILRNGNMKHFSQTVTFFNAGEQPLFIEGQEIGKINVEGCPSTIKTEKFEVLTHGERICINATLRNFGSDILSQKTGLKVNGTTIKEIPLNLQPGETYNLNYTYTAANSGNYTVTLEDNRKEVPVQVPALDKAPYKLLHINPASSTPLLDISGNSQHPEATPSPLKIVNKEKRAAFRPGNNSYLKIENNDVLNQQKSITLCAWVYPEASDHQATIIQKGYDDNQYVVRYVGGGYFYFKMFGVEGGELRAKAPAENQWSMVVCQYDSKQKQMQIWINGQLVAEKTASGLIDITGDPLFIGLKKENCAANQIFPGYLGDIRMYEKPLSQKEIEQLSK